jgi:methylmalonyl-CoA mutase
LTIEQAKKRLTTVTVDGIAIEPLYCRPEDQQLGYPGQAPFTRGSRGDGGGAGAAPWVVAQLHEDPDTTRTAEAILADLNAGGTGVWLRVDPDAIARRDLATVLAGVEPEAVPIMVCSIDQQAGAAQALLDFWAASGKTAVQGNLGIDPLANAAISGEEAKLHALGGWVEKAQAYPGVQALAVDVTPYDNAGAGDVDQLAFAIATAIEYVRTLEDQEITPEDAFAQILFRVSVDADEFLSIARLRALRRLWARVGEVLDVPEAKRGAQQHAVTSLRMVSKDDPWVNLLRNTVGAFAAAVGGAEAVTILPHDAAYGLPTAFSRRVARNIQLVAAEESHLGAVKDPAGGAWVFEALTEQLAEKAWARLQEIEAAGGMAQALAAGQIAEWIAATNTERDARLATRKIPLTGVSMFPMQDEEPLTDFYPRPVRPSYDGLKPRRNSEVFEGLRDRSRAHAKATGAKPTVVLACLGDRRDYGPREQFTTNLLWVGGLGFATLDGPSPEAIVDCARQNGIDLVILASSAKVYAADAPAALAACQATGLRVWLAGRKSELDNDQAAGLVDGEIFDGMDVVAFLTKTLDDLGVAK